MARTLNPNPTPFNLMFGERGNNPLASTGGMTYHHAIPFNVLRDFWDCCVRNNLDDFRLTFLRHFAQSLRRYPVCPNDPVGAAAVVNSSVSILDRMVNGDYAHAATATAKPPCWVWLRAVYTWMPGNLFVGPSNRLLDGGRGGDPGAGFDNFASQCVPEGRYSVILQARRSIDAYVAYAVPANLPISARTQAESRRGNAARVAGLALARVAEYDGFTPFDANDWRGTGMGV